MKTITWLHISDFHFCPDSNDWDETNVLNKLSSDLDRLSREQDLMPDLIFVSGDLIYGAKPACGKINDQFEIASLFLMELSEKCQIKDDRIVIVPGNHDVDVSEILDSQTEWLEKQEYDTILSMLQSDTKELPRIMKRLDSFREFFYDHKIQLDYVSM